MRVALGRSNPLVRLDPSEGTGVHRASDPAPPWRLIAFPPSGAGASFYQPWASDLADFGGELYSVRYPGRESRFVEPFATSIAALADEVADAAVDLLREASPLPTVILGHSMGASVAAETTARVEAELPDSIALLVLAAKADPRSAPSTREGRLRRLFGRREKAPAPTVEEITATDASLTAWMRDLGGTPAMLLDDPDFMAMQLPIMRADLLMSHRHTTIPDPIDVPMVLLSAGDDVMATHESMSGWADMSRDGVTPHTIDGGHHALLASGRSVMTVIRSELSKPPR